MTLGLVAAPQTAPVERAHSPSCTCEHGAREWYLRYAPMIRQFIHSRTGDPAAAEDCTSETFLRALAQRHRFQCRGDGVRPWLFTIARNLVHDYRKPAWRRLETPTEFFTDDPDRAPSPEQAAVQRDTFEELAQCVDRLTADQAQCVRLRFFDDLSVKQTAHVMRRREIAIRTLQHRAVRKLAAMLAESTREQHSTRPAGRPDPRSMDSLSQ